MVEQQTRGHPPRDAAQLVTPEEHRPAALEPARPNLMVQVDGSDVPTLSHTEETIEPRSTGLKRCLSLTSRDPRPGVMASSQTMTGIVPRCAAQTKK